MNKVVDRFPIETKMVYRVNGKDYEKLEDANNVRIALVLHQSLPTTPMDALVVAVKELSKEYSIKRVVEFPASALSGIVPPDGAFYKE